MITFKSNIWERVSQTVGQILILVCYFVSSDNIITDMIYSDDPSKSLKILLNEMNDRGINYLDYNFDVDYVNPPVVGSEDLSSLCYDVMTTDEHEDSRPDWCPGFSITDGEITWKE